MECLLYFRLCSKCLTILFYFNLPLVLWGRYFYSHFIQGVHWISEKLYACLTTDWEFEHRSSWLGRLNPQPLHCTCLYANGCGLLLLCFSSSAAWICTSSLLISLNLPLGDESHWFYQDYCFKICSDFRHSTWSLLDIIMLK